MCVGRKPIKQRGYPVRECCIVLPLHKATPLKLLGDCIDDRFNLRAGYTLFVLAFIGVGVGEGSRKMK